MVTVDDIISAICQLPDELYQQHTSELELRLMADVIAPFLMELLNCSLSTATVTEVVKSALITPLLKKPHLDSADP